jgi:hypothetical protein
MCAGVAGFHTELQRFLGRSDPAKTLLVVVALLFAVALLFVARRKRNRHRPFWFPPRTRLLTAQKDSNKPFLCRIVLAHT